MVPVSLLARSDEVATRASPFDHVAVMRDTNAVIGIGHRLIGVRRELDPCRCSGGLRLGSAQTGLLVATGPDCSGHLTVRTELDDAGTAGRS